jgi:hypothetical protein
MEFRARNNRHFYLPSLLEYNGGLYSVALVLVMRRCSKTPSVGVFVCQIAVRGVGEAQNRLKEV